MSRERKVDDKPVDSMLVYIPMDDFNKIENENEKKQYVGNYLYQYVFRIVSSDPKIPKDEHLNQSSKVTGMIIDGQSIEFLLYLCKSKFAFNGIVDEATELLGKHVKEQSEVVETAPLAAPLENWIRAIKLNLISIIII